MPIYEFVCQKCSKESEILVRSSRWEGTACPHCGSKKLEKKLSLFASSVASSPGGECCPDAASCAAKTTGTCCGGGPHCH